jgi:hypothetical protein
MKTSTRIRNIKVWSRLPGALAFAVALGWVGSTASSAQSPPPGEGTVALEGTMKKFYRAANTVIVATVDGVEHVYHFTKDLVVHGGKGRGPDALEGLREGSTVVVHYTGRGETESAVEIDRIGDEGLKVTEGTVTRIDRGRKQITVRFDDKRTETFRLTDRAAAEVGRDLDAPANDAVRVTIYYTDEAGRKVAHFFKKTSRAGKTS